MTNHYAFFIDKIEAFLARTGMPQTTFGKAAINDTNFVRDLREGRRPNLELIARVNDYMAKYELLERQGP